MNASKTPSFSFPSVNPVRKVGLWPRLYKELMLSIYNMPGINAGTF
jgi:hypothetical protein